MVQYFHYHCPDLEIWFDKPLQSNRCTEICKNGNQCRKNVVIGSPYCSIHLKYKHFLAIGPSTIENSGNGVFVIDPYKGEEEIVFRKGDRICYYDGEIISYEQLVQRYSNVRTAPYVIELHNNRYEDGALKRGIGTIINHKPTRNCNCRFSISKNNRGQVIATKNIKNSEELFANYGREYKIREKDVTISTNRNKYVP